MNARPRGERLCQGSTSTNILFGKLTWTPRAVYGPGHGSVAGERLRRRHGRLVEVPGAYPTPSTRSSRWSGRTRREGSASTSRTRSPWDGVKTEGAWNEARIVSTVRATLDHHLGAPPETVVVEGQVLTPRESLAKVVRLDPDGIAVVPTWDVPSA